MKITVIGGTGMVGSATVTEAAGRGHEVVSASRSGRHAEGAAQDVTLTLTDTQAVVDLINSSDATVITVSAGRGESAQPIIDAHRALIAAAPAAGSSSSAAPAPCSRPTAPVWWTPPDSPRSTSPRPWPSPRSSTSIARPAAP